MRHSALNEPLTVMIPLPDAGTGVAVWSERRAAAIVQPDTAVAADGTLDDRSVMLISAGFEVIPGMIAVTDDGKKREITAVRVCRTIDGRRTYTAAHLSDATRPASGAPSGPDAGFFILRSLPNRRLPPPRPRNGSSPRPEA